MTLIVTTEENLRQLLREELRALRAAHEPEAQRDSPLLTPKQVAERCQVREETVRGWIHSGRLIAKKPGGRRYVIHEVDFQAFLARADAGGNGTIDTETHLRLLTDRARSIIE